MVLILLKELRNYNRKLFLCPPQKQAKTQSTFETFIFQNIFTFWYIKINIYIWKTKFKLKTLTDFLVCLEKLSDIIGAKSVFSCVHVTGTTCYDEGFLF